MIITASVGILAGMATLVLASIVLRAGKDRPDNRLFAAMACLAGVVALATAVAQAASASLFSLTGFGALELVLESIAAGLALLFAYSFPTGRKPSWVLWPVAGLLVLIGSLLPYLGNFDSGLPATHAIGPWLLLVTYAIAILLLLGQRTSVPKTAHGGLWLVTAAFALRWILNCASAHHGLQISPSFVGVSQILVIGFAVLRYHLLDVRRVFQEASAAWIAALAFGAYVALTLTFHGWLREALGTEGMIVAVSLPPAFAAWAVWTWREELGAVVRGIDPHRGVRRELMERVLAVTGHIVDPEAVLAMIRAAMLEVFPKARVDFRRARNTRLLQGISSTLPESFEIAIRGEHGSVLDMPTLLDRHPELAAQWAQPGRLLLPVRRGGVLYGAFELDVVGRTDADDLLTASAMADHLAVKLENVTLSSSLGRAGRELENIRTFVEDLIESLPVGIVGISGKDLEVRLWNPFEARRTGIDASEVLGKRYLDQVADLHVEPAIAEAIRQRPNEVLSFPNVGWGQRNDASVDVTVAPLRERGGAEGGYVLIMVDATERNALHQEVEDFRRLAALGEFAAAIAHDIRTPLSSIRMSVQILRSKVVLPPEDMEYFDLTLEAISRLGKEVEELLDFTKPAFLRVDMVPLHEIVEDARDAVDRGVTSDVSIEIDVPSHLQVPVDEAQVRSMLVNLLQNAVQASEPGAKVWLEAKCDGDEVSIAVRDEGRGIAPEDLDRIWDPFFTTRTDGTGLGLALVRKTVTAHGGALRVESALGHGTTFFVSLPARRATEVLVPIDECRRGQEI